MTKQIVRLPLDQIMPGSNDRTHEGAGFDTTSLRELAQSIAENGLIEPIIVRPAPAGNDAAYQIVAGERRWRAHHVYTALVESSEWEASSKVQPGHIDAIVSADMTEDEASTIMLIENEQREDLDEIDRAHAYQKRLDAGWKLADLARVTGKSSSYIASCVRLLSLVPEAQQLMRNGNLMKQFALEICDLRPDFQRNVLQWLSQQTYTPTLAYFRKFVDGQRSVQNQQALFDMRAIVSPTAVRVAEDPNLRLSDTLPPIEHLPALPITRGKPGVMVDAYIAALIDGGHIDAAAVLLDFWRKMMKANKLQLEPWDSKTLTRLEQPSDHVLSIALEPNSAE